MPRIIPTGKRPRKLINRIKPYTLVRWNVPDDIMFVYYSPYSKNENFLFISEITNMPGHCMLLDLATRDLIGPYHTDNFRICTEEEV